MAASPKSLIDKLNGTCKKALEQAIALCMSRTHFNVEIEHWLLKILDNTSADVTFILRQYAIDAVGAVSESGSKAKVATFDLSQDVVTNVKSGKILFAVDQQPYVQGFLGVTALYLDSINGNIIGGGQPVYSGPAFVTKENAAQVEKFAAQGTR